MIKHYDIAIVGSGIVGLATALGAAQQGLRVLLVGVPIAAENNAQFNSIATHTEQWDQRIYALSPANQAWLTQLKVWQEIRIDRIAPVYDMKIFGDASDASDRQQQGYLGFSAYQAHLEQLAWIIESSELLQVLQLGCRLQTGLTQQAANFVEMQAHPDHLLLTLSDGTTCKTHLLVGADGANSSVRAAAQIAHTVDPYPQSAVVANFHTSKTHADTACQWFRADGILALLPMPGARVSMVWSANHPKHEHLLALSPAALAAEVTDASQQRFGNLQLMTPAACFPLRLLKTERMIAARVALVGDAAHVVHPLAGQGMNLGLQDAQALLQSIAAREQFRDCGDQRVLERYQRARAEEVWLMRNVTDGLQKLFAHPAPWASLVRNTGMQLLEKLPFLKNRLIQHAVGRHAAGKL